MSNKYTIQRFTVPGTVIDQSEDADEIVTDEFQLNGLLKGLLITSPDLDDTDTFTISLKDADGYTIFTRGTLAEGTVFNIYTDTNDHPLEIPLSGSHTITITASGDQAADRTFVVKLLVQRG
jgi:hypothetical protein